MFGWKMDVDDDVGIELLEYRSTAKAGRDAAGARGDPKAEMSTATSRHSSSPAPMPSSTSSAEVEMDHLHSAIKLVEESGRPSTILTREKTYVKLAKYIAAIGSDVTHADLNEALPFYKGAQRPSERDDDPGTAWGYKNNIIIKKSFIDGIEFFTGETLKETDLRQHDRLLLAPLGYDYINERCRSTSCTADQARRHPLDQPPLQDGHRSRGERPCWLQHDRHRRGRGITSARPRRC